MEVGGWCTPHHLGWAQLGGVVPTLDGHSWAGEVAHPPPWNGNRWGGVVHLPWSEGKLGVVDIQAFEVGDGVVQEEDTSKAGGGVVQPPLA